MDELPELRVRMYLDVRRPEGDISTESAIVRRFASRFRERHWPGARLPEIYYDPRASELDHCRRASLHAKCIVVDATQTFVSSANFTKAAHLRNIEVGLLVRSSALSRQLIQHFEKLAAERLLRPVPLG
jgi:phosphatidylserine/phosphatidylglycerophosphate/cardiolipin synthase-like enzyme